MKAKRWKWKKTEYEKALERLTEKEKMWMKIQSIMAIEAMKQVTAEAKEKQEATLKKWYNMGDG